jgi:hypothetical protein
MDVIIFALGAGMLGVGLVSGWEGLFDDTYFADKRSQGVSFGAALIAGGIALMGLVLKFR